MKESYKIGLLSQIRDDRFDVLMKNYTGIIRHKVEELLSFEHNNFIKCEGYKEYKTTSDFDKLMKIGK